MQQGDDVSVAPDEAAGAGYDAQAITDRSPETGDIMARNRLSAVVLALGLLATAALSVSAQQLEPYRPAAVTAEDYARAERYLGTNMNPLVLGGAVTPRWIEGDRFWYRNAFADGFEYVLVDPARKTRRRAFDHAAMAQALSAAAGGSYTAFALPDNGVIADVGAQ